MRSLLEVAECVRRTPPCMHTLEHALHVCLAAALDNAPAGALYKIQEVVVEPESHQHLHWECQHLVVFFWGGGRRSSFVHVWVSVSAWLPSVHASSQGCTARRKNADKCR
jgi:hypothetical protein